MNQKKPTRRNSHQNIYSVWYAIMFTLKLKFGVSYSVSRLWGWCCGDWQALVCLHNKSPLLMIDDNHIVCLWCASRLACALLLPCSPNSFFDLAIFVSGRACANVTAIIWDADNCNRRSIVSLIVSSFAFRTTATSCVLKKLHWPQFPEVFLSLY